MNNKFEKYLNIKEELPIIKRFAFLGNEYQFNKKLEYLQSIAETKLWNQTDIHTRKENSTLFYYILHTFERCFNQEKLVLSGNEKNCYFNTGLITHKGDEIYGKFIKNSFYPKDSDNYWYLKEFVVETNKMFMNDCGNKKPALATYYENYSEMYFNPEYDIVINFDHIYDDNYERLPVEFQKMDKKIAYYIFEGCLKYTKKKIKRNQRIPIPQFYNNKLMYLIPLNCFSSKTIVIALEKINNQYRGNTILSLEMAYNCARLINKQEDEWLINSLK